MRTRYCLVLVFGLFSARTATAAEGSVGGWTTLTHHQGPVNGYRLNDMNRNDNSFSTLRTNIEGQLVFEGGLSLNVEYMIDVASVTGMSNTFLRPWATLSHVGGQKWLNLTAGSLQLVFGTYGERANSTANPVIGVPLMHGYHTDLSMGAVPINGDSLINRSGRGQYGINYGTGTGFKGMPTVYEPCWDVGLEAYGAAGILEYAAAITYGTPSGPVLFGNETNDEAGVVGRIGLSNLPGPLFGARIGASAATGAFYADTVPLPPGVRNEDYDQIVFGYDAEYSRGRVVVRSEGAFNTWELPANSDPAHWLPESVNHDAYYFEGSFTVSPMIRLGGRYDLINFGEITTPRGTSEKWDADVRRAEVAVAIRPKVGWELKVAYQDWNYPDFGALDQHLAAVQLRMDY